LSHSPLVRQNCTVPQGPVWQDVEAVPALRSYVPQQTCPLGQSAASRQWSDALSVGQDAVAPGMHESPPSTPTQHVLLAVAHGPALPHSICPGVTGSPPSGMPPLLEAPELLPLLEPAPELEPEELVPMPELDPELDPLELPTPELEPPELALPPAGACDDPPHPANAATASEATTSANATGAR
jgi:hypothetical protein